MKKISNVIAEQVPFKLSQAISGDGLDSMNLGHYKATLASNNQYLLQVVLDRVQEEGAPKKYQAMITYPIIDQILRDMDIEPKVKNKVLKNWHKVDVEELLGLNLFLQMIESQGQGEIHKLLGHYFEGGLFAVRDNGNLYRFFKDNTDAKDRQHDCSHPSSLHSHSAQGYFIPELLFGTREIIIDDGKQTYSKNGEGNSDYTWWQTEYASLFGKSVLENIINYIAHKISWVIYKITGKNVGPYGQSEYMENNIKILDSLSKEEYEVASAEDMERIALSFNS